jgi:hypothetical protein
MALRTALSPMEQILTKVFSEHWDGFNTATRLSIAGYERHGFEKSESGQAELLTAVNLTTRADLQKAGIVQARRAGFGSCSLKKRGPRTEPGPRPAAHGVMHGAPDVLSRAPALARDRVVQPPAAACNPTATSPSAWSGSALRSPAEALRWIRFATEDLKQAEALTGASKPFRDTCAGSRSGCRESREARARVIGNRLLVRT